MSKAENILADVRLPFISRHAQIDIELRQSLEEGRDLRAYETEIAKVRAMPKGDAQAEEAALLLCCALEKAPRQEGYAYDEPETIEEILALFPPPEKPVPISKQVLEDKILGAWLGRAAGCLLGQPVEGWMRERIQGFAKDTGNYPIERYFSSDVPPALRERYAVTDFPGAYGNQKISWLNNIEGMPEDDDTNYTVLGLYILEKYGRDFTAMDVAEALVTNIPLFLTHTAERMAYKNIANGILPPRCASYGNPYREWLGGQIRVDSYAYVNPGKPWRAAEMALRDACVTHTKNGLYASAFCAALIAVAAKCQTARQAIDLALSYIPPRSRLRLALEEFLALYEEAPNAEKMMDWVHQKYNEADRHDWCHVIPNDMIICLALLCAKEDFTRLIGLCVEAGFDTDCNAATAGSVFGMMYGANAIGRQWIEPLGGAVLSRVGYGGRTPFAELVRRTVALAEAEE